MEKPGPTGEFPRGVARPGDEGELNVGFAQSEGVVYMNFATPVNWMGMRPDDARVIARKLLELADEAEQHDVSRH